MIQDALGDIDFQVRNQSQLADVLGPQVLDQINSTINGKCICSILFLSRSQIVALTCKRVLMEERCDTIFSCSFTSRIPLSQYIYHCDRLIATAVRT